CGQASFVSSLSCPIPVVQFPTAPPIPPGKTVFTSDEALKLEWIPDWIAIVGSGYIGLEFSDVYTALGAEVTFIEALDIIMPGFDPEIGKLAQRVLITPRSIDYHTGVLAKKVRGEEVKGAKLRGERGGEGA
ncbi:unnamed protein product, partial [Closterium sp. NIES-54]